MTMGKRNPLNELQKTLIMREETMSQEDCSSVKETYKMTGYIVKQDIWNNSRTLAKQ